MNSAWGKVGIMRNLMSVVALTLLIGSAVFSGSSQSNPDLQAFFRRDIGLSRDQIATIRSGHAVAKNLHSRDSDEIFVFGAVYVNAAAESYLKFSRDFDRLRKIPEYLAVGKFSDPPQLSDLKGFTFDSDDIKALKNCKPGDCQIQMPASSIENLHQSVDLSAPEAEEKVNQLLQKTALERLVAYQRAGNEALGVYNDKRNPTEVPEQFKYMLSYSKALPKYLPAFYHYLLTYPDGKPSHVDDTFYWAKVNFGLKPTLRVVHVVTMRGNGSVEPAYIIAEKQLYSSHYFETALDLTVCLAFRRRQRPRASWILPGHGDGLRASWVKWFQGVDLPKGCGRPISLFASKIARGHQERFGEQPVYSRGAPEHWPAAKRQEISGRSQL